MSSDVRLSLADVIASRVPLDWSEAVAVIAELCAVVTADDAGAAQIPDATDAIIEPSGAVSIAARSRAHDATYAPRLLQALLSNSTPPAPLRLFVSNESGNPTYRSVAEFGEALAYYERPGRAALIHRVFERCSAAPPGEADLATLLPPDPAPPPKKAAPKKRQQPLSPVLVAVMVLAAGAAGAGAWWFGTGGSLPASGSWTDMWDRARTAFTAATNRVKRDLGMATPPASIEEETDAAAETPTPGTAVRRTPASPRAGRTESASAPASGVGGGRPGPAPPGAAASDQPDSSRDALPPLSSNQFEDFQIYSAASPDVVPPSLEDPTLARPATSDAPGAMVNRIEVLVDAQGEVRQVRLVSGAARMSDLMLLSAVKAWRFRPALLDGRPVRYRVVLDWPVNR